MHAIETDPRAGLVATTFYGELHVDERCAALDRAVDLLRRTGVSRLLIDLSLARIAPDGLGAANRLANRLARDEILEACRVAYVERPMQQDPAVQVLATAKGFDAARFCSREQALAWLLGDLRKTAA
jgi:hypothetical protein